MEPIKNALAQAGNLVQQAAHAVVEVFQNTDNSEAKGDDEKSDEDKNIDSKQKQFEDEQQVTLDKSGITKSSGGYQDQAQKVKKNEY